MFSEAQRSSMDLQALGRQLKERKLELMGESGEGMSDEEGGPPPSARSRRGEREQRARSS